MSRLSGLMVYGPHMGINTGNSASGSRAATAINAAYSHLVSGTAIALRAMAPTNGDITALYVFMDAYTGTLGNIALECNIYAEDTAQATRPGSTLRATSTTTTMPGAADQWIKFEFGTPYTPSIGEILWFVIENTSASPTVDYPSLLTSTNYALNVIPHITGFSTTNGFTTNGTTQTKMPFVLDQDGSLTGVPYTQSVTHWSNNSLKRGVQFTTPGYEVSICGAWCPSGGTTSYATFSIYADSAGPGDVALHSFGLDDSGLSVADSIGARSWDSITLSANTTYKAIMTYDASTTVPSAFQIEDYSSYSSMFDSLLDAGGLYRFGKSVIDDGASGWTINRAYCPGICLIEEQRTVPAGGGGAMVIGG